MKTLQLIFAILTLPLAILAQDVDIAKDGTVTIDGKKAFTIEGKQGMVNTSFSISNLDGDLLISADGRNENNHITVTFTGSNASLDYPLTLGTKKVLAKDIAKMQVIKEGQLNPDGIKRFVAKYNGRADRDLVLTDNNTRNTINVEMRPSQVSRNRNANIIITSNIIKQDNKEIGKITSRQQASQGTVIDYFTISNTENQQIADVSKAMNTQQINIITYDNKHITIQTPNTNTNKFALQEIIVKELINRGLL